MLRLHRLGIEELSEKAERYTDRGMTDSAAYCLLAVANKYSPDLPDEDKVLCIKSYNELGEIYIVEKNSFFIALEFFLNGLSICERDSLQSYSPPLYNSIGNFYSTFEDYTISIRYYEESLRQAEKYRDTSAMRTAMVNLTAAYCMADDVKSAENTYRDFLKITVDDDDFPYYVHYNKGLIQSCRGEYSEAIASFRRAVSVSDSLGLDGSYIGSVYLRIAQQYEYLGDIGHAIGARRSADKYFNETESYTFSLQNLKALAQLYRKAGMHAEELSTKERYFTIQDSLFDNMRYNKAKSEHFLYESNKAAQRMISLEADMKIEQIKADNLRNGLVISVLFLSILTAMLFVVYRQKKRLSISYLKLYEYMQERMRKEEAPATAEDGDGRRAILPEGHRESLAQAVSDYLSRPENFCDPDLTLEKLSRQIGSNSKYVSLAIHDSFNKNFRLLVNEYRIREAIRRLSSEEYGKMTVTAIGESVGYKSASSFYEAFRKETGMTPSIYQKILKSPEKRNNS